MVHATPLPIARHGLNARKTSPNRRLSGTNASQKMTSGTGRSVRTEMPCAIRNTRSSVGLDRQLAHERVAAGLLRDVTLYLEDALDVRDEVEPRRLTGPN